MSVSKRCPAELRARAVRMYHEESAELKRLKRGQRQAAPRQRYLEGGFGFLRGRARPARPVIIDFIREHADHVTAGLRWGVEPICRVLTEHGVQIAPSTFYE